MKPNQFSIRGVLILQAIVAVVVFALLHPVLLDFVVLALVIICAAGSIGFTFMQSIDDNWYD